MFVVDTNILIQGHQNYYPEDSFLGLWDWILTNCNNGNIIFIPEVLEEIKTKKTNEYNWVNKNKKALLSNYSRTDNLNDIEAKHANIVKNSTCNYLKNIFDKKNENNISNLKDDFLLAADFYLVCYAEEHNYTVITYESYNPNNKKKILIPNYCSSHDIKWESPRYMFSKLGLKL